MTSQTAAEDLGLGVLVLLCSRRNSSVGSLKLHPDSQDAAFLLECVAGISPPNLYPSEAALNFESHKVNISHINTEEKKFPFFFKLMLITNDNGKSCAMPVKIKNSFASHSVKFFLR